MRSDTGYMLDNHGNEKPRPCRTERFTGQLQHGYTFFLQKSYDHSEAPYIADLRGVLLDSNGRFAGNFEGEVVDIFDAYRNGQCLAMECDAHSHHLLEMYESVLFNDGALCFLEEDADSDLLHLAKLQIQEEHRGKGLGLEICAGIICKFLNVCGYAVMKPFPLQWGGEINEDPRKEILMRKDREKLIEYYRPLGFHRAALDSDYWVRELSRQEKFAGIHTPKLSRTSKTGFPVIPEDL